jgi:exosortase
MPVSRSAAASAGGRIFPRALFPFIFLLWIIPLPGVVLDPIVNLLQEGSVASAPAFFCVPAALNGTQLSMTGLTVEVARECSSIRSSLILLITTMVLAELAVHSIRRQVLIIAIAIPLSVARNGLLTFLLAMLTTGFSGKGDLGNLGLIQGHSFWHRGAILQVSAVR